MTERHGAQEPSSSLSPLLIHQQCNLLNSLRVEKQLCDVVLKVKNGELSAHKVILTLASPYFRTLFTREYFKESSENVVKLEEVDMPIMESVLEYIYTQNDCVNEENVEDLLITADMLQINDLVTKCCEFLKANMDPTNCIAINRLSEVFALEELRDFSFYYALIHFCELTETEEYKEITAEELCDLVQDDRLNLRREQDVFEAVVKWVEFDKENRQGSMNLILPKVRLALMDWVYFVSHVTSHELMRDKHCNAIVVDVMSNASRYRNDFEANLIAGVKPPSPSNSKMFPCFQTTPRIPYEVVIALGGWSFGRTLNIIECYNARVDRWIIKQDLADTAGCRSYYGLEYLHGLVYVIGGFDGVSYLNSTRTFDPVLKTWADSAPMHAKRCFISVVSRNGFLYAIGGYDGYNRLSSMERFDPLRNQWSYCTPMRTARSDACAVVFNDKIYVFGGFKRESHSSAEMYDPETEVWEDIAPMSVKRSGAGAIVIGNRILVIGGFNGMSRENTTEMYNPNKDTWRPAASMETPRSNFGMVYLEDKIRVIGGFNGISPLFKRRITTRNSINGTGG